MMTRFDPIPEHVEALAKQVVDSAYQVHQALGPGLPESVCEKCLVHEITSRGIRADSQVGLPISYRGVTLESGLCLDLVVEDAILIEVKAVSELNDVQEAQILTYLKFSGIRLGFLINFNTRYFKEGLRRRVL